VSILQSLNLVHPRLIASSVAWERIAARRLVDPLLDGFLGRGEAEARAILDVPPVIYRMDGKRLLHVSRAVLRRVLLLALHYHLTGDEKLAWRAEQEILAAASFSNWNPSHFLDVAEMTAALAFGYDWLYGQLGTGTRNIIVEAIVEKGLKPGLADHGWANSENNWNSVCLSGLSLGALAIADIEPELASQVLELARTYNHNGLKVYAPGGVYPEGSMYWGYGTAYQAILINAFQSALGTDWGLSDSPGFMESANAVIEQLAPGNTFFNFSDGLERPLMEPAMWWFAHTLKRPELLSYERYIIGRYSDPPYVTEPLTDNDRLLPLAALWWPEDWTQPTGKALRLNWYGEGANPLAVFRSAWDDPNAMYLALKGGSASLSHAHMDAGSFVFEANGVRWAHDLGMQDYLSLESKGIDLWNSSQGAGRWNVFRLNNFSHNTLTINGLHHCVNGHAVITHFSDKDDLGATVDLSAVFAGQAESVIRSFAFRDGHIAIFDDIAGLQPGDIIRWAMVTRAGVAVYGDHAILSEDGRQLTAGLASSVDALFEVISAEPPDNGYDAPNPGYRLLVIDLEAPASGRIELTVTLRSIAEK